MKTAKDLIIPFSWAERRPIFLQRFLYIPSHYEYSPVQFFDPALSFNIEFCSGNGQWIVDRAKKDPTRIWLAVEKKFERARKIWQRTYKEKVDNVQVVCSEGLTFTRYYAPKADYAFINFPDPWPKRYHAIRRLIRLEFLQELLKIMELGGRVFCTTDDPRYANQMRSEFAKCPQWKLFADVEDLPDYGESYFKDLWTLKGRTINYLCYERQCD